MATIWLLKDFESLPIDSNPRYFRTALLAQSLLRRGHEVVWFTSRFDHKLKRLRPQCGIVTVNESYKIVLLEGPGYKRNISLARVRHQQALGNEFSRLAAKLPNPAVIVTCYPAPELCLASCNFAIENNIPYFVDARDPWPDSFAEFFPAFAKPMLFPILARYRKILSRCAASAEGLLSISSSMLSWLNQYSGRELRATDSVFYLGLDSPGNIEIDTPREFTAANPLRCIFSGNFSRSYDGASIVEAMRLLQARGYDNVQCVLVGDGAYSKQWQKLAAGLSCIEFTGWLDKDGLSAVLKSSQVGIIPIRGGNSKYWMGNRLAEYSAFGLAVINTSSGDARELIAEKQFGVNILAESPTAIADALADYIANPGRLQSERLTARGVFDLHFDSELIFRNYAEHILQAIPRAERLSNNK